MAYDGDDDPMQRIDDELWARAFVEIDRLVQQHVRQQMQLAYGGATDMFVAYLHIGETTARECDEFL